MRLPGTGRRVDGPWGLADHGARTPAHWLSHQLGLGSSTAADHLRVGLRLRELPAIRERFAAGRISYSKVRAITRIAVPETEDLLHRWSQWATGAEVERIISAFRSTCRAGAATPAPDRDRSYRSRRNGDGTTTITIRLPDDEAAAVETNLDGLIDLDGPQPDPEEQDPLPDGPGPLTDEQDPPSSPSSAEDEEWVPEVFDDADLDTPSHDGSHLARPSCGTSLFSGEPSSDHTGPAPLGIEGLLALDAAGAGTVLCVGNAPGPTAPEIEREPVPLLHRQRTRSARRVDALVDACAAAVSGAGADTSGMDRHTLVLRTDIADLQAPDDHELSNRHVPVETPAGQLRTMDRTVLRRLACEANLVLVATDGRVPLDVGRQQRRPTVAQRRALLMRDRACRFPGCDARRNLHAHHIVHWADGGPTDLANLVLICAFHHRFVHEYRWRVIPAAAGIFRFAPPGGSPLPSASPLAGSRSSAEPSTDPFTPDVKGWALRPTDYHPRNLDLHLAIEVLHQALRAILPPADAGLEIAS